MSQADLRPIAVLISHRFVGGTVLGVLALLACACGKQAGPPPAEEPTAKQAAKPQQGAPPLWKPVPWEGPYVPTPQATRSQPVQIDLTQLDNPSNDRISLALPDGSEITALKTKLEQIDKNQFVWRGTIDGDKGGVVTFSVVDDRVIGDIVTSAGRRYRVRSVEKGISILEQLDPGRFPAEEAQRRPVRSGIPGGQRILKAETSSENPIIDVLVLYTNAAETYASGGGGIAATVNLAVSDTRQSYANSGVGQDVTLVGIEPVQYEEKSDILQDWHALKDADDSELNEAHELRQSHAADIVVLLTKPASANESCGQASQMQTLSTAECAFAFAVVPVNCATGTYSFAHELGHLMGADHNAEALTNGPPFPYSHGYETPSKAWHTVMASPTISCEGDACPPRILNWSNPSVSYSPDSSPPLSTGVAGEANNALTLRQTASTVAAFFPSPDCGQAPAPPQGQTPAPPHQQTPRPPNDLSAP